MFFWNKICVIGLFFFICSTASAQITLNPAFTGKGFLVNSVKTSVYSIPFTSPHVVARNMQNVNDRPINNMIPQDYYTRNFGFFCKQELRVEKSTKIPISFRVGSLQQCNYYEGKK